MATVYRYNSITAPPLPDSGDYRYAYVSEDGANPGEYLLTYITCPMKYFEAGGTSVMATETSARFAEYRCADGKTWEFVREQTASGYWLTYAAKGKDWSNHDIFDGEGNLYLAASDPIPVPTLYPTSMLQGWIVGRRIAAQRGKA